MTKKFWADWQKRIDETESIRMKFNNDMNGRGYMLFIRILQKSLNVISTEIQLKLYLRKQFLGLVGIWDFFIQNKLKP